MKLLSVLSLSLVLSCTTLSAQKVYEISAFGLKANRGHRIKSTTKH